MLDVCRVHVMMRFFVCLPRDFRHEKTKKKRGSYRGGVIDPSATFSTKFESDDE
jgi:hypothetical protein